MKAGLTLCRGWRVSCDVGQQLCMIRHFCAALLGAAGRRGGLAQWLHLTLVGREAG